jgi:hypothetical protein
MDGCTLQKPTLNPLILQRAGLIARNHEQAIQVDVEFLAERAEDLRACRIEPP